MSLPILTLCSTSATLLSALLHLLGVALSDRPAGSPTVPSHYLPSEDSSTVLDGVYSASQAMRGQLVFESSCMRCHALSEFTSGQHAPIKKFETVGEMFSTVSSRMPVDDPGSHSPTEYAAVISYLLKENSYPAGKADLPADPAKLAPIRIVPLPGSDG